MKAACLVLVAAFWCANGDEQFMSAEATHAAKTRREVLGSLQEMNGKESQLVKELSNYAVSTLDDIDADNIKRTVVDIIDAKKQLVNGIMYHLELKIQDTSCIEDQDLSLDDSCLSKTTGHPKICKIRLHRAFVTKSPHDTKVVSSECNDEYEMSKAQDVPANSAYIRSIAEFASEYLNKMTNSIYWFKLINIMEAKTQIVGGINTYLTLELHSTSCSKHDSFKSDEACTVDPATKSKMLCRVVVLEQPDHEKHMKKSSCSTHEEPQLVKNGAKKASGQLTKKGSKKAKRSLLGSEAPVEANDENVESLKKFLSHQLTSRANSEYIKRVVEVLNVSSQVVSGKLTRATVRVADTNCLKSENRIASECELSALGQQLCTVTILEQPWLNKKELTQSECHAVSAVIGKGQNTKLKDLAKLLRVDANSKDLLDFSEFMTRENKIYKTNQETVQRFHIFRANMLKAAYLNKTEQGTAWYGATMFADLTKSEFRQYTGLNYDPKKPMKKLPKMAEVPNINIPPEFDWRDHNVVTPVKNQGLCGSCWAFSVTGNIEGLNAIASGTLTSFSEQELVDCDKLDSGCNGGFFNTAFESIEELGGLETESDYPYAGVNEKCYLDKSKVKVQVKDYVNITSDENEMAKWLVANGPISIALNANAMQFYMGGVSHPFRFLCDPDNLDHGVLIVGYGVHRTRYTHKLLPYWLIKNSWGPRWGNKGYYMAYRGDGTCGLNKAPTSAILE